MTMDEIRRVQSILQQQAPQEQTQKPAEGEPTSFKETLAALVQDVNHLQQGAEEVAQRLVTGDVESIHQVMVAMEEANTSFKLMMEMRNKIMEAYKEIMKMQA